MTGSLDTTFHGSVLVHSGATLLVKPGAYRIGALTFEWGAILKVDTAGISGNPSHPGIQLVVDGDIQWMDGFVARYPGLSDSLMASRMAVYVSGAHSIIAGNGDSLRCQLVAPQSSVNFGYGTELWGRVLADNITWGNGAKGFFSANGVSPTWSSSTTVAILGARRFWTNATSVSVAWTVNGVTQTVQTTEALPAEGPHWIKRSSGGSSDSVQALVDRTAPVVQILSPIDGTVTKQSQQPVTWSQDGVSRTDTSALVEGMNTVTRSVTDSAGNTGSATVHVTRDTHIPVVVIVSPADGLVTNQAFQTVQWTADGVAQTPYQAALTEGSNTISKSFTSPAGNTGTKIIHVTLDTKAPEVRFLSPTNNSWSKVAKIAVNWTADGVAKSDSAVLVEGSNTITRTATDSVGNVGSASIVVKLDTKAPVVAIQSPIDGYTTTATSVQVRWSLDGMEQTPFSQNLLLGSNAIAKTVADSAGNQGTASVRVVRASAVDTISAGAEPAPSPINPLVNAPFSDRVGFLFQGTGAVQTGVQAGSLPPDRLSVAHGRVLTRDGVPLQGVLVSILRHPEWGSVRTRADGRYDIALAVGGYLDLDFKRPGVFEVQRHVQVQANDIATLPDVLMVAQDPVATPIVFGSSTDQAMVGSTSTDVDGSRTPVVIFPAGVQATVVDSLGVPHTASALTFRATEYTVGANGPSAMPGPLQQDVAYTYAVELSADEAVAAKAQSIQFDRPLPFYVENFLGFPVGIPVPLGYFDRTKGLWVASESGVVIKILSIVNGRAQVDVNGSGQAAREDSLIQSGWTTQELNRLGARYAAGQSLWRMPISHFSAWDANWGIAPPPDAVPDSLDLLTNEQNPDCCHSPGSVVGVQDRSLGESVSLPGTGESVVYASSAADGASRYRTFTVRASGDSVPHSLKAIEVTISVAGQTFQQTLPASSHQNVTFTWDGKDVWGRPASNAVATSKVDYVYNAVYESVSKFGYHAVGYDLTVNRATNEFRLGATRTVALPGTTASTWNLATQHRLDFAGGVVHMGSGGVRKAVVGEIIETVASNLPDRFRDLRLGPDGSYWVPTEDDLSVQHYGVDGHLLREYPCQCEAASLAFSPDGFLYISTAEQGVYRLDTASGAVTRLYTPNEISWGLDADRDGRLLVPLYQDQDGGVVQLVQPDGSATVVAGGGTSIPTDGILATQANLGYPNTVMWGKNGDFYVGTNSNIYRVDAKGRLWIVAGNGTYGNTGDGGLARNAQLTRVSNLLLTKSGDLCYTGNQVIRCISPDGIIRARAGTGVYGTGPDGISPTQSPLNYPAGLVEGADGNIYFNDQGSHRIRRIRHTAQPDGTTLVPDAASGEVWVFDATGRHLRTIDATTGDTLRSFEYDASGRTVAVRTPFDTTHLEYPNGSTVRYIGSVPYGGTAARVTTVQKDANGQVTSIVQPDGKVHSFTYQPGGLMESYQKPNGRVSRLTYDATGSLVSDADGDAPAQTLVESKSGDTTHLIHTDAAGTVTEYVKVKTATGTVSHQIVNGALTPDIVKSDNGAVSSTLNDGTIVKSAPVSDPQWGLAKPLYDQLKKLPNGDSVLVTHRAVVQLSDIANPLSLVRRVDTIRQGNAVTTNDWNPVSRLLVSTDPVGAITTSQYDSKERLVQQIQPSGDTAQITYDDAHNLETWIQQGRVTKVWKNRDGQVDSVLTNEGDTLRYVRDGDQQPTNIPQPGGSNVSLRWDDRGRLVGLTPSGKPEHQFLYTKWGGDSLYLPPSLGDGQGQVGYVYDKQGRLIKVRYSGLDSIVATFDAQSRWSNLNFGAGSVSFQYPSGSDLFSQATRTYMDGSTQTLGITAYGGEIYGETWSGQISGAVSRTKDLQGNLGVLTVAGTPIAYAWTLGGQLTIAGDAQYTPRLSDGQLFQSSLGNLQTGWNYGYGTWLQRDSTTYRGTALYKEILNYEPNGRITGKTETVNGDQVVWGYNYTNGRLTTVSKNGVVVGSYGWDNNGNRAGSLVDAQDRLVQQDDAIWSYDALGNLKTRTDSRGTWTFTYDALWNLLSATGPQNISYVVDPRGRRVGRKVNGTLVQGFLYGGQLNPVAELNGSGAVVSRFVYGSRANVPDYMIQGDVNYRLITDHLGSVRLVVNASTGAVVSRIDYDVWGNVTVSQNLSFQPFGFAGGLRDDATGLVRFGARDYDPHVGRWTGRDPLGINGRDQNVYSYSADDPINFLDMNGLTWAESTRFFGNWLIGQKFQSDFGPGTNQVNDMVDAPGVNGARDLYYNKYPPNSAVMCQDRKVGRYGASFGLTGLWKAGLNSTQQFIGSYTVNISTNEDASLNFNLTNNTSFTSFLYGLGPSWTGGPGGSQIQNYHWTEPRK